MGTRTTAAGYAMRKNRAKLWYSAITFILLITGSILILIPFYWLVSNSLKASSAIMKIPPQWIPHPVAWENYYEALTILPFAKYLLNTCTITSLAVFGQLLSASLVAYGFARFRFPLRGFWFIVLLSTLMLPSQVTLIPVFKVFAVIGWYDTFKPLIVPAFFGGGAFYIFLLRQYFMTIPRALDEAAEIDGAGSFTIFWRILLPQAKPALATVAVFSFMSHWNDFLGPLIFLSSPEKRTLALGLYAFTGQFGTDYGLLMAASTAVMMPLLVVFFFAQKYFIQGIALSGLKG